MDGGERHPVLPTFGLDRLGDSLGRVIARAVFADGDTGARDGVYLCAERPQAVDRQVGDPIVDDDY